MKRYKYRPYSNRNREISPNVPRWAKLKKKLILNQTSQELHFYQTIKELCPKLRILPQKLVMIGGKMNFLDFYIPRIRLAIEIDGEYHKYQTNKDEQRDRDLLEYKGIQTLRFENRDIDTDCLQIVKVIISMF